MEAENGIETEMENQVEADPGNNDKRVAIDTEIQDGMNSENNNMNSENDIVVNDIGEEEIAQELEKEIEKTEKQDDGCKETAEVAIKEKNMEKTKNEKEMDKENVVEKEPNNNITTTSGSISSSIAKFGAPVQKKEKGMFRVVQTEKCAACQKTVYAMEKLEMNGHNYHRNCFKCSHCSARLTPKTFSMNEGVIYCTNHFKQLFARKGNYDEGFGRQQYKKKWQDDKPKNEDSTASA